MLIFVHKFMRTMNAKVSIFFRFIKVRDFVYICIYEINIA